LQVSTKEDAFASGIGKITESLLYYLLGVIVVSSIIIVIIVHFSYQGMSMSPFQFPQLLVPRAKNPKGSGGGKGPAAQTAPPIIQCLDECSSLTNRLLPLMAICYIVFLIVMPYLIWVMRRVKDSLYMRQEIMMYMIVHIPLFIFYIVGMNVIQQMEVERALKREEERLARIASGLPKAGLQQGAGGEKDLREAAGVIRGMMPMIGLWSFTISVVLPVVVALFLRLKRTKLDYSTESFNEVILNKKEFAKFKEVLAAQLCVENGLFTEQFLKLTKLYVPPKTVFPSAVKSDLEAHHQSQPVVDVKHQEMVIAIYDKFIAEGSPHELNILGPTRRIITQKLKDKHFHPVVFCQAWKEVYGLMFHNSYKAFLHKHGQ
jgi:hypothetical protein